VTSGEKAARAFVPRGGRTGGKVGEGEGCAKERGRGAWVTSVGPKKKEERPGKVEGSKYVELERRQG